MNWKILKILTIIAFIGSVYLVIAWLPDAPIASLGFGVMAAGLGSLLLRMREI